MKMRGVLDVVAAGVSGDGDSETDRRDGARENASGSSTIRLLAVAGRLRRDSTGAAAAAADRGDRDAGAVERAGSEDGAIVGQSDRLRSVDPRVQAASLHGVRRDVDAETGACAGSDAG